MKHNTILFIAEVAECALISQAKSFADSFLSDNALDAEYKIVTLPIHYASSGKSTGFGLELSAQILDPFFSSDSLITHYKSAVGIVALTEEAFVCLTGPQTKVMEMVYPPDQIFFSAIVRQFERRKQDAYIARIVSKIVLGDIMRTWPTYVRSSIDILKRNHGLYFPWACQACTTRNWKSTTECRLCGSENDTYDSRIAADVLAKERAHLSSAQNIYGSAILKTFNSLHRGRNVNMTAVTVDNATETVERVFTCFGSGTDGAQFRLSF